VEVPLRAKYRLLQILVLKSFISAALLGLQLRRAAVRPAGQVEPEKGSRDRASGAARAVLASCSPIAPIIPRTRGGSKPSPEQALEASFSVKADRCADGFSGESSLVLPARRQEIDSADHFGKAGPCFRPARMNDGVAADEFAGQAEGAGGNLAPARLLCRESEDWRGDSRRETPCAVRRASGLRGVRPVLPKAVCRVCSRRPCQAFKPLLPRQAREGRPRRPEGSSEKSSSRHSRSPRFDLLADEGHDPA